MTTVNTVSNSLVDINMDCDVTWSPTLNSSTVYYPAVIDAKTVEQIKEEFANGTLKFVNVYDRLPLLHEDYAYSRDSTPSPRRLYIDESEDSVETVEQINGEFANGTLKSSTVNDPVPLIYDEYANSRASTPSPGKLYIDESKNSENLLTNSVNMDECSITGSTPTRMSNSAPLCPINEPTSPVDVKNVKKAYEKHFPHHPKPKLRRHRINACSVPKKLDFDQPEEDSE